MEESRTPPADRQAGYPHDRVCEDTLPDDQQQTSGKGIGLLLYVCMKYLCHNTSLSLS